MATVAPVHQRLHGLIARATSSGRTKGSVTRRKYDCQLNKGDSCSGVSRECNLVCCDGPGFRELSLCNLVLVVIVDRVVPAIRLRQYTGQPEAGNQTVRHGSRSLHHRLQQAQMHAYNMVCPFVSPLATPPLPRQHNGIGCSPCRRRPTGSFWCECSGMGTQLAPPAEAYGTSDPSEPSTDTMHWRQTEQARE